jgi:hypothetical protein
VTKASKGASVFLALFALPFLGFGLFGFVAFLRQAGQSGRGNTIFGALLSLVFAFIGGGLFVASIWGYFKLKEQAAIEQSHPDSPWLWRQDWAAGRADSLNRNSAIGWWIMAGFCNLVTIPITLASLPRFQETSDPKFLIPAGFGIIGIILLVVAVRATLRRQRFGKTYLELQSLPFTPGGRMRGAIHLRWNTSAEHGIKFRLSCMRKITSGNGNNRSTSQVALWEKEQTVPASTVLPSPFDTVIPVEFAIPSDAYESNHESSNDQILWLLHVEADVPGIDYADSFEVPVFHTASSRAGTDRPRFASEESFSNTAPAFQSDDSDVAAPAHTKIVISTTPEGHTEFYWPAFRHPSATLFLLAFTIAWTGIVYVLWHSKAPFFFAIFFGFFDLLLIYGVLSSLFGTARVVIGNGKLAWRRSILPARLQEVAFGEIDRILPVTPPQQNAIKNTSYSIRLWTKGKKKVLLADSMGRDESRWIVAQMEALAGLKRDTHIELDSLYVSGAPPQRARGSAAN